MSSGWPGNAGKSSASLSQGWADLVQTCATGSSQDVSSRVPGFKCQNSGPIEEL